MKVKGGSNMKSNNNTEPTIRWKWNCCFFRSFKRTLCLCSIRKSKNTEKGEYKPHLPIAIVFVFLFLLVRILFRSIIYLTKKETENIFLFCVLLLPGRWSWIHCEQLNAVGILAGCALADHTTFIRLNFRNWNFCRINWITGMEHAITRQ